MVKIDSLFPPSFRAFEMDIRRYFRSNQNENLTVSAIGNLVLNEDVNSVSPVSNGSVEGLIQDDNISTHQKGIISPNNFEFVPGH